MNRDRNSKIRIYQVKLHLNRK